MNVLDLFSGIGGFSLGLERAGMTTVAFCEIEPYPQAVLRKNFPGVPIYDDVRTVTTARLCADGVDTVDLVCGGFPCQPFSTAGKQLGTEDDRFLWPEMCRIVQEFRPSWVIGENVAGFVNMGIDYCISDLEAIGYEVQPFIIPACAVGAEHRRDRVWIVAHSRSDGFVQQEVCKEQQGGTEVVITGKTLAKQNGSQGIYRNQNAATSDRWDSFGYRWSDEPEMDRVVDGVPNWMDRLKCLGNAVVPQIPEIIGRAIMRVEGF